MDEILLKALAEEATLLDDIPRQTALANLCRRLIIRIRRIRQEEGVPPLPPITKQNGVSYTKMEEARIANAVNTAARQFLVLESLLMEEDLRFDEIRLDDLNRILDTAHDTVHEIQDRKKKEHGHQNPAEAG